MGARCLGELGARGEAGGVVDGELAQSSWKQSVVQHSHVLMSGLLLDDARTIAFCEVFRHPDFDEFCQKAWGKGEVLKPRPPSPGLPPHGHSDVLKTTTFCGLFCLCHDADDFIELAQSS